MKLTFIFEKCFNRRFFNKVTFFSSSIKRLQVLTNLQITQLKIKLKTIFLKGFQLDKFDINEYFLLNI